MSENIQQESRVKKTLLNARVNLIFYFITLVLSFFSRKIFLNCLGASFIGLTGTMQNLLGFLNLAELGIGSAIGFVLYKPLFEHDRTKISEIISVMGYLYRWIGFIILGSGIILSFFLPLIFPDSNTGFSLSLIYFVYYTFLTTSLIGYFINYRQNLLGADQRNYVVTGYFQSMNILKMIIQMILAYYTGSYFLWVIIELTFGIIYSFIINWKINQTYPWLKTQITRVRELLKEHHIIIVKTRQIFIHKIASFAQFQTVPFLTYAFVNLHTVALYGNYTIITDKLSSLLTSVVGSNDAGVGNVVAEGNKQKTINVFWELTSLRYFVAGFFCFSILILTNPFIKLWLGQEYILHDIILYLLVTNLFLRICQGAVMPFIWGYGMYGDVWSPIAEIILNIGFAVSFGSVWGLPGILLGGIASIFIIYHIWKPIYLFHFAFKISMLKYVSGTLIRMICTILPGIITIYSLKFITTISPFSNFGTWLLYGAISVGIYTMLLTLCLYSFNPSFRQLISRFIKSKR